MTFKGSDTREEKDVAVSLTVRFPRATINEARAIAERMGVPLSYVVRQALKGWVKEKGSPPEIVVEPADLIGSGGRQAG